MNRKSRYVIEIYMALHAIMIVTMLSAFDFVITSLEHPGWIERGVIGSLIR